MRSFCKLVVVAVAAGLVLGVAIDVGLLVFGPDLPDTIVGY